MPYNLFAVKYFISIVITLAACHPAMLNVRVPLIHAGFLGQSYYCSLDIACDVGEKLFEDSHTVQINPSLSIRLLLPGHLHPRLSGMKSYSLDICHGSVSSLLHQMAFLFSWR